MKANNVALVTGGAKRIGKEIALYLAQNGYSIALHYNTSEKEALQTKKEIEKCNVSCSIYKANLSSLDEVTELIKMVKNQMNDITLLINSASVFRKVSILETKNDVLIEQNTVNYLAPFVLIREYAKLHKNGTVINLLDARLRKNEPGSSSYFISKKSLEMLTHIAAKELAPGIRVNGIAPGVVLPPPGEDENYIKPLLEQVPLKRKVEMKEIMQTIQFFIDNTYVTGQVIYLDGGQYL